MTGDDAGREIAVNLASDFDARARRVFPNGDWGPVVGANILQLAREPSIAATNFGPDLWAAPLVGTPAVALIFRWRPDEWRITLLDLRRADSG